MKLIQPVLLALAMAALAACGDHGSLSNTSIANGAIRVSGDQVRLHAVGSPVASIDPTGEFSVDGQPVQVTPAQRALLLQYYAAATAVRVHGIETGKAGVAIAGEALKGAAASIVSGGDDKSADARVQAKADKVEQAAMKICDDLAGIRAAQEQLAAALPAFKPYGGLIGENAVDDCRKDNDN